MSEKPTFTVKRAFREGLVKVSGTFKAGGYRDPSISTQIACEISTDHARELAATLIAEADRVDEKVKKKADAEARREKWREREVAAGRRMASMSWGEFMGRRS